MGVGCERRQEYGRLQEPWRTEHLFAPRRALDAFNFCGPQLARKSQKFELCIRLFLVKCRRVEKSVDGQSLTEIFLKDVNAALA